MSAHGTTEEHFANLDSRETREKEIWENDPPHPPSNTPQHTPQKKRDGDHFLEPNLSP
jgi:hypothetical protein